MVMQAKRLIVPVYVVGAGYSFDMAQPMLAKLVVPGITPHDMAIIRQKLTDTIQFTIAVDWYAAHIKQVTGGAAATGVLPVLCMPMS